MLTTGNIETNNDAFTGTVSSDSIPRAFAAAGKTWKAYMESLPSTGYTGGDVYPYFKHHNPFAYMTDVLSSSCRDCEPGSIHPTLFRPWSGCSAEFCFHRTQRGRRCA